MSAALAEIISVSLGGRVPRMSENSASVSATASAVAAVCTLVCIPRGLIPRRQSKPVRAPYVNAFSSRSFRLMRLTNCPPRMAFMTTSGM